VATITPTMIEGSRVDEGDHFFDSALGLPVSPWILDVSARGSGALLALTGLALLAAHPWALPS
jgi:hypothetical protein